MKEDLKVLEVRSRHRWKMSRKVVSWERILGRQVTYVKFLKQCISEVVRKIGGM